MKKELYLIGFLIGISCSVLAQSTDNFKMTLNGFGDIVYGQTFGPLANPAAATLYNLYGDPNYPTGMHNGFTFHGADFLGTVAYKDNFKFQTEINIEGSRGEDGGETDLEVERCYLDYGVSEKLSFQVGYMFTPIGYINRNLYSRAWLMNSIRFYQAVASNAGILPNHYIGATAYGNFLLPGDNSINYIIGYGKARDLSPANENFNNTLPGYQLDGNVELNISGKSDFKLGLGGFTNQIHTYNVPNYGQVVTITDSSAQPLLLQESGFNPYIHYSSKLFNFLAEYDYVVIQTDDADYPSASTLTALSAELAINCKIKGKRFAPYVRYENILMPPNDGPYYGLRVVSDNVLTKVYVPNLNAVMFGIAYDLSSFNRVKIEYIHHFDGPYVSDGIYLQTAFGF